MTTTYVNAHNYYLTLQAAILSSYASFVVVFSRSASHIPALFSSTHIVLTALFLGRLYMLTSTGQRLIRWGGRSSLASYILYFLKGKNVFKKKTRRDYFFDMYKRKAAKVKVSEMRGRYNKNLTFFAEKIVVFLKNSIPNQGPSKPVAWPWRIS